MRKVNLKVKARLMVPIIVTYSIVATVDDGVPMERVAVAALRGSPTNGFTLEDSSFTLDVEDSDPDTETLDEKISDYVEGDDSLVPKYISHEVTGSR